ncbi:DUF1381 domain-containing protein [Staphylococcus pettenkoferi]|uniref:DUF1381 domain-containing protein n=1 Tax=Staphylococcus pettenkoferi TaxID=170573 RepID=UPI002272C0C1|nr:DUF1381 domain-containing protein [Staphylococcus pettenkoferi]MCY1563844.1 DUF1381 domain-containing protein [Staphylococcus pettenkoferi]
MTQYLIKTIKHDTGEIFQDVMKARMNETFEIVEANDIQALKVQTQLKEWSYDVEETHNHDNSND